MKMLLSLVLGTMLYGQEPGGPQPVPDPSGPVIIPTCGGCKLKLDAPASGLPTGISVTVDWGGSKPGGCTVPKTPGDCVASGCSFDGVLVTVTNDTKTDYWLHDDRWTLIPKKQSTTFGPDDDIVDCGGGMFEVLRTSRVLTSSPVGSFKVLCTSCPE